MLGPETREVSIDYQVGAGHHEQGQHGTEGLDGRTPLLLHDPS